VTKQLPTFRGYVVDERLKQFRKLEIGKEPEFIDFSSQRGRELQEALWQEGAFTTPEILYEFHEEQVEIKVICASCGHTNSGIVVLKAVDAVVRGTNARYESGGGKDNIGYWTNPDDYVIWRFKVTKAGTFDTAITFACAAGSGGSEYAILVAKEKLAGKVKDTGSWTNFVTENIGTLKIEKPGTYNLSVKPETMPAGAVMNLKSVTLVPVEK